MIDRQTVLRALDLYLATSLSFRDAFVLATMERLGSQVLYSFDRGFDSIKGIQHVEP